MWMNCVFRNALRWASLAAHTLVLAQLVSRLLARCAPGRAWLWNGSLDWAMLHGNPLNTSGDVMIDYTSTARQELPFVRFAPVCGGVSVGQAVTYTPVTAARAAQV